MEDKRKKRRRNKELTIVQQLRVWGFWRGVLAEFIGSYFYVLIVSKTLASLRTTLVEHQKCRLENQTLSTDLAYGSVTGLTAMALTWILCDVSGGHVNPALTIAMALTRRVTVHAATWYIMAQCTAAVAACATLFELTRNDHVGVTVIHPHLSSAQGVGVEVIITFLYVFSYFASMDRHRHNFHGGFMIAFGSAVTVAATFAVPFTGSSFNPARSLGPAVIERYWHKHWIYWVGPLVGGSMGGLCYDVIFAGNASLGRMKAFFNNPYYDADIFNQKTQSDQDKLSTNLSQKLREIEEDENYFNSLRQQTKYETGSDVDSMYLAKFKDISDPASRHLSEETLEMCDRIAAV